MVNGHAYPMPRHGFARQSDFELLEADDTHAAFSLTANEETLKGYPFEFDFQVIYALIDNALRVAYKVINLDDKTIYFSVGGHPAFSVPFKAGGKFRRLLPGI